MIGGALDWRRLAEQHRPHDLTALAAEVRRLHAEQHMTPRDIAMALRLPITDVLDALVEVQT